MTAMQPERQWIAQVIEVASISEVVRRPREDALPEHLEYRYDGCDLFVACLSCPLPRCRYDEPGGARAMLNRVRDEEIRRMRFEAQLPVDEIATRFRVSRRTVFRALESHGTATRPITSRDPHAEGGDR